MRRFKVGDIIKWDNKITANHYEIVEIKDDMIMKVRLLNTKHIYNGPYMTSAVILVKPKVTKNFLPDWM